jgi:capsular exopolysaccharide synthesis family protein
MRSDQDWTEDPAMLPPDTLRLDKTPIPSSDAGATSRRSPAPAASPNGTAPPLPPARTGTPPALARTIDPRGLLRALRRQWVLAFSAALALGVVTGCIVYAALPPTKYGAYTARASLYVSATPPVVAGQPGLQPDFGTLKGTIQARVTSRAVLAEVLARPDVKGLSLLAGRPDPYDFLRNELVVDWAPDSEILNIRMSGDRPNEQAVLVNAVAEEALQDVNSRELLAKKSQLDRLEKIHNDYEASLGPRRRELEELAKGAGLEPGQQTLRQVLAAIALNARQAELLRVQGDRRSAEALLKLPPSVRPSEAPPAPESHAALDDVMKSDPDLQPLLAQITDLNSQIARYTALYRDNPDRAKQVIKEKGLQTQIDALYARGRQQHEKKVRAASGRGGAEPARPASDSTEELKARIASYDATEEALSAEIKKLEGDLHDLEARSGEIDAIRREIAVRDEVSRYVAAELEKLRLEVAAPPRAAKMEEASVPTVREERRLKLAGLGGLGGAALALFGVAFLDVRRRKLHTVADVTRGLELPVAGTQPLLSPALNPLDPAHAAAKAAEPWYGRPNDNLDATRVLLMRSAPPTAPRVVAVTGAVGGEGTSVLAAQLAACLARAGRRTLLLDANLRRPAAHRAFGLEEAPGLAEVLRGEAALPDAVRPAAAERLWVLPAGAADLRAVQGLSRESVQLVIDQLKRDYEYIVIDSAPALPCADALALAQRADAVIVSVLAGASVVPMVHAAWQRLSALGARLAGVVVQGAADDGLARMRYWFRK